MIEPKYLIQAILFISLLSFSCKKNNGPQVFRNYDLQAYKKIVLPAAMDEISGITFSPLGSEMLAINDEEGKLFFLDPATGKINNSIKFGKKNDYEDLVLADSAVWILISNGNLVKCSNWNTGNMMAQEYSFPFNKGYEFETAYTDSLGEYITLICKLCAGKQKGPSQVFRFNTQTLQYDSGSNASIDYSEIKSFGKKTTFRPSAAAINPADGNLYVISSLDKMIFAATPDGKMLNGFRIDPDIFKQPEGICFKPDGTLYISNEAAGGNANLLAFEYRKQKP
jgi:uncharacterized protein YjiK